MNVVTYYVQQPFLRDLIYLKYTVTVSSLLFNDEIYYDAILKLTNKIMSCDDKYLLGCYKNLKEWIDNCETHMCVGNLENINHCRILIYVNSFCDNITPNFLHEEIEFYKFKVLYDENILHGVYIFPMDIGIKPKKIKLCMDIFLNVLCKLYFYCTVSKDDQKIFKFFIPIHIFNYLYEKIKFYCPTVSRFFVFILYVMAVLKKNIFEEPYDEFLAYCKFVKKVKLYKCLSVSSNCQFRQYYL